MSTNTLADPDHRTDSADRPTDVDGAIDADSEARSAIALGLYVSAARCIAQYVVAPLLGGLGWIMGPFGLVLKVLGAITSIAGLIRLRRIRGSWSIPYAVLTATILLVTVIALVHA